MVFVHARNETLRTAKVLRELALNSDNIHLFAPQGKRTGLPVCNITNIYSH